MNKTALIIAGVAIVGIGAYLLLKPKSTSNVLPNQGLGTNPLNDTTTSTGTETQTTQEVKKEPVVKPITAEDLLAVTKLKDSIISDINTRNSYSKASSRANVQSEIDKKLVLLKGYGFSLDTNNELIKTS